jgi:hypothetical protein
LVRNNENWLNCQNRQGRDIDEYLDLYIASRHSRPKFGSLALSVKKLRALPLPRLTRCSHRATIRVAMGFKRRKIEDERRQAADEKAAGRRATDAQVLEDAER